MPDKRIDLRGVKCPLNFVKAKLALEQLSLGKCIEIVLDHDSESAINVPNSFRQEGHLVLSEEGNAESLTLLVQRAV